MIETVMIAPCGMNCSLCARHLAYKNAVKDKGLDIIYCFGCRKKENKCSFQKKCPLLAKNKINYCFECNNFPCENLKRIDKRYRTHYRMSMIENLKFIKDNGMEKFLEKEEEKWKCKRCPELISCHNELCFKCDLAKLKTKKKLYRWEEK